jgi:hypothetical protein
MKRTLIVNSIAVFFIMLFLYTGSIKLMDMNQFREELTSSPLVGSLAGFIAWALPITEIIIAIVLFIPKWQLKGLYASLILMSLFTGYVITILLIDSHLSCSCGGIIEELSPRQHIFFNSACVVLAAVAIAIARRQNQTPQFRWFTASSALAIFLFLGWTLFTAFTAPAIIKTGMEGRLLPSFNMLLVDSTTILNSDKIPTGKPLIVFGFDPKCKHCQAETADIVAKMDSLKDTRILYISPFPIDKMRVFYRHFKLQNYPNIIMGQDTTNTYLIEFKATAFPFTTVFDPKKRLKTVFAGQASASDLIKATTE